jgi:hypothetical protein
MLPLQVLRISSNKDRRICHVLGASIPNRAAKITVNFPKPQSHASSTKTYFNLQGLRIFALSLIIINLILIEYNKDRGSSSYTSNYRSEAIYFSVYSTTILWTWIRNQYDRSLEFRNQTVIDLKTLKFESQVAIGRVKTGQHLSLSSRFFEMIFYTAINITQAKIYAFSIAEEEINLSPGVLANFCGLLAA